MSKVVTKEELIKRYLVYITLSTEEKTKMRSKMFYPAKRYYGSWANFLETMKEMEPIEIKDAKKTKRPTTDRIKRFCATLKMAQDTGRKFDVLQCMEAVRRGDADCIRII